MKEIKITKTNKLNAIIAILDNIAEDAVAITIGDTEVEITKEDLIAYCEGEIEAIAKKAAKAKETAAKKKAEDPLYGIVKEALTAEPQIIADITEKVNETAPDASLHMVTYRLTKLTEDNVAKKVQVTIPATGNSKAKKVQAYCLND